MSSIQYKRCNLCEESKPLNQFDKDKCISSGYRGRCKQCRGRIESERKNARKNGTVEVAHIAAKRAANDARSDAHERQRKIVAQANANAIRRLITSHEQEFRRYVADERMRLKIEPTWLAPIREYG